MKKQLKIKVCGMRDQQNITDLENADADFMGLIFYDKSPRNVPMAQEIKTNTAIQKVGVFVNETQATVLGTAQVFELDYIQLHGQERPEFCDTLKERGQKVIKAFSVDSNFDFNITKAYESGCELFLFDTKGKKPGGNGKVFDWSILKNYKGNKPFLLSGGLSPEMLSDLKEFDHPQLIGLDLNSGFEIEPALKDITKIKNFLKGIKMNYTINESGYYGEFGGAFIPEMLYTNVEELRQQYLAISSDEKFQREFKDLLKNYVGRPSPLYLAKRLSAHYETTIYLKREDLNHTGAHKINNTIGQILLAQRMGKKRIIAETGAGQHGVATATVCALMGVECIVYMGAVDIERQAPNVSRMRMLGAKVVPANSGSKTLKDATNEAIRDWINNPVDTHYIIGSVVGPHPYPDMVARFQSVISEEMKAQLIEQTGNENPDIIIACVGGGSNAAGAYYHYLNNQNVRLVAVEAAGLGIDSGESAATSVLGTKGVIHGSRTLLMQTDDGQIIEPYSLSAGLDYPGIGPMHAHLIDTGRAEAVSVTDQEALDAAFFLSKKEGIIPALESAHAFAALDKIKYKKEDIIVINLSGRGDKDLATYVKHFDKDK